MTDYLQFAADQIKRTQTELRADNAAADDLRWTRWVWETASMINHYGLWNVLARVAELVRDRERFADEGSPAKTDWRICAETLEEAAEKCDLRNAK